jgi:hypothetical protein
MPHRHHDRHFPVRPALDELLEAAELDDVQAHLMHLVLVVEQHGHLAVAFDARHRVDRHAAQGFGVGGGFQLKVMGSSSPAKARRREAQAFFAKPLRRRLGGGDFIAIVQS